MENASLLSPYGEPAMQQVIGTIVLTRIILDDGLISPLSGNAIKLRILLRYMFS